MVKTSIFAAIIVWLVPSLSVNNIFLVDGTVDSEGERWKMTCTKSLGMLHNAFHP